MTTQPLETPTTETARPAAPNRASFWQGVWAIVWKDLLAELRSKELISAMVVFSLLDILIFNFALELHRLTLTTVAAGVLWVTAIFAGTLGLNRSLAIEKDRGSLDGLLLAPIDRSALYLGKLIGNWLFMLIVQAIILPVFSILFNINLIQPWLLLVIGLGTLGYAAVGTLLAALAVHSRSRDVMLPILLFPVSIPVLIAAIKASNGILAAVAWDEISPWLNMLIAYDVIFFAVALMVFEYVVEE